MTIPLAISTADNTAGTADTIDFTCDGASLINGGAWSISKKGTLSSTVSNSVGTVAYGPLVAATPLPILYPPQTFYVNGAPVVL